MNTQTEKAQLDREAYSELAANCTKWAQRCEWLETSFRTLFGGEPTREKMMTASEVIERAIAVRDCWESEKPDDLVAVIRAVGELCNAVNANEGDGN